MYGQNSNKYGCFHELSLAGLVAAVVFIWLHPEGAIPTVRGALLFETAMVVLMGLDSPRTISNIAIIVTAVGIAARFSLGLPWLVSGALALVTLLVFALKGGASENEE